MEALSATICITGLCPRPAFVCKPDIPSPLYRFSRVVHAGITHACYPAHIFRPATL
jgi:hypothetical protein